MIDWIWWGSWVLALFTVPSVLVQRVGRPTAALSWILALQLVPPIALVVWWTIGRTYLDVNAKRRARVKAGFENRLEEKLSTQPTQAPASKRLLATVALPDELRPWVFPPTAGNRVRLLEDSARVFDAWESALAGAREHVHLLFYIWRDDRTGLRFRDALVAAARRGVKVRLLLDGLGTHLPRVFFRPLKQAGGKIAQFLPLSPRTSGTTINFRNHRKLIVVDGTDGFVGGLNVADEYLNWLDLAIHVHGTAVDQMQEIFCDDWFFTTHEDLADTMHFGRCNRTGKAPAGDSCATIASGPHQRLNAMREIALLALTNARQRIWIMTPYFVPDPELLGALRLAHYRGADVRVMVPACSDVPLVRRASRAYYPELLAAGVRIFEYDGMLHAKACVFDDQLISIGSANLDARSFRLNFELSCVVESSALNAQLATLCENSMRRSSEMFAGDYANLPWRTRTLDAAVHLLSPLL